VLVHYSNSEKEADAVVTEISKAGGRAEKVAADLRQADGRTFWPSGSAPLSATGSDILVANAGISKAASLEDTRIEDVDNLFAVNVPRAVLPGGSSCCRPCARAASVVLLSSLAAQRFRWRLSAYAATKGANRYPGQAFRLSSRRARYPRQCRRSRRGGDRHVGLIRPRPAAESRSACKR